jgi:hypothetical protein
LGNCRAEYRYHYEAALIKSATARPLLRNRDRGARTSSIYGRTQVSPAELLKSGKSPARQQPAKRINEAVLNAQRKILGEYIARTAGLRAVHQQSLGLDDQKVAEVVERSYALKLAGGADNLSEEERRRIQTKQGGHHMPLQPEDGAPCTTAIQTRS